MIKKRILITGASQGIGRQLAIEYSKLNAKFILLARNENNLKQVCHLLNSTGSEAYYQKCDVTSRQDVISSIEFAEKKMGGIDIAILNSGISLINWYETFSSEIFESIFKTNLFGLAYFLECLIPLMMSQGNGIIAGIGSLADCRGMPGSSSYSASKIGVKYILEAARAELEPFGIKVITVRPGFVDTDIIRKNKFLMPFMMDVESSAKIIVKSIEHNKKVINFPLPMVILSQMIKLIPGTAFEYLSRISRKKD